MESTTNTSVYTCEQNLTKEYKGAKKKLAIPQRMLEDDVWLSGSELRTDNSSSDEEEKIPSKKVEEDDFKKGARKKTTRTKTKVVKSHTEKHQYSETTECTETITSMTSEITIDTENSVQFEDSDDISYDEKHYLQECHRQQRKAYDSIVNQLENQIQHAEELYMASKERTNVILKNLSMVFEPFSNHEDNNLRKFIEIIKNLARISANCYLEDSPEKLENEFKNIPREKHVRFHVKKHKIYTQKRKKYFKTGEPTNLISISENELQAYVPTQIEFQELIKIKEKLKNARRVPKAIEAASEQAHIEPAQDEDTKKVACANVCFPNENEQTYEKDEKDGEEDDDPYEDCLSGQEYFEDL